MKDGSLLIVAREDDPAIPVLRALAPARVVHAGIADLSREGWRYVGGDPARATAGSGGRVLPAVDIAAVLCRLPRVTAADLPAIDAGDRAYAANEMTAFLRAWLAQFGGIRCNEPTWSSLAGPAWESPRWARTIAALGIPMASDAAATESRRVELTVAGGEVFGSQERALIRDALRIARAVKARVLSVEFAFEDEWCFAAAHAQPRFDASSGAALLRAVLPSAVSVKDAAGA